MTIDVPERGARIEGEQPPPKSVGRRTVLAGAAWTVPAVALAAAAPAHAASGLVLAFDKTSYTTVGCGTLKGVTVSVSTGGNPTRATVVTVSLPTGLTFASGQSNISGATDAQGVFAVPDITVANTPGTLAITATAGTLNAAATVRVAANSSAAQAIQATPANPLWPLTPPGSVNVGANYFLAPNDELWWENNRVASGVVAAAGWNYNGGEQYVDYRLADNTVRRAMWANTNVLYDPLPLDARPIGQAYFLTDDGVLYHYAQRVTGNVKSVVTWADGTHHADIELTSGVLIRTTTYNVDTTYSPLPESARPIGADYFLSDDGDLFFRSDFVVTQVTSAAGWYYEGALYADYMTESGEALRVWEKNDLRNRVYTGTPAGARSLGCGYFITEDGLVYWWGRFAISNADNVVAWHAGYQHIADVRTTSGASIRLYDNFINSQWSPLPENALSIGASYYYDSENQELYYKGKLLVTGVTSAAGWHWPGNGDYCDYTTARGTTKRARYETTEEATYGKVPAGGTAHGAGYFLVGKVLWHWEDVVATKVVSVKPYVNGYLYADFELESGVIARAQEGAIIETHSPMPSDAASVGADYFLTPGGELYWQGRLVSTGVSSASGFYFRGWGWQYCDYVTGDAVAHRAREYRPLDGTFSGAAYATALSRGYFLTKDGSLYWYDQALKFGDGTPVKFDKIVPWSDQSYMHADIRTPDGKYYRLIEGGVQYQYWQSAQNPAPVDAVPVGIYYFLTPSGDLYYNEQIVATGVSEAAGWFDATRTTACVDYRDGSMVVRRIDNGNAPSGQTYPGGGVPQEAKLLGSGYFLTGAKDLLFANPYTSTALATVASNPTSLDTWNNSEGFYVTYRPASGQPRRITAIDTGNAVTWVAGNTPLGATLIGSKYALSASTLWFAGTSVMGGVTDAVGWSQSAGGHFYADVRSSAGVVRIDGGATTTSLAYGSVPPGATLFGYGYQLAGSQLLFQGNALKDDGGNVLATSVVSGFAWGDGGGRPLCDYRTEDLGSFRVQRSNNDGTTASALDTSAVSSGDLVNWTPNRGTPVGSEPRGADYFVTADGVLTFQGQLVDSNASDVVGWAWGGDRFADYRVPATPSPKRMQAKGIDKTIYVYSSQAAGTSPIGSGYWFDAGEGEIWYKDGVVATGVLSAHAWTWGNPAVNWRDDLNRARRREVNVNPPVTTFTQGTTPLGSKPIGAEYFLNNNNLYYQAGFVTDSVERAIGYFVSGQGHYADYFTDTGDAFAVLGAAPTNIDYTGTDPSAIPVGAGYFHVPNGKLYYNGKVLADAQRNELGNVASAVGWSNGTARVAYALIEECTTSP